MKMTINSHSLTTTYYQISDDIKMFPEAWAYIVVGGRNTGKTYGALKYYLDNKTPIMFLKRTAEDVKLLTSKGRVKGADVDLSPYKSINRDTGLNIKAFPIESGLGSFYDSDEEGNATGDQIGYIMSLNQGGRYKGADFSECDALIFDEFIPQPWERINRKEGEMLLDLYKTVSRDRVLRGRPELKLICLANAVNVYNPTCAILGLTDIISQMSIEHEASTIKAGHITSEFIYIEEKQIFVRLLPTPEEMLSAEKNTGIYKAMHETQWGAMAWDNSFAYNDFSNVKRVKMKGYRPICKFIYKKEKFYIYMSSEGYYITHSGTNIQIPEYNLNKDSESIKFYYDYCMDIIEGIIEGRALFETYSMYDIIFNYKQRFKIL